jgi:hypothetical protein
MTAMSAGVMYRPLPVDGADAAATKSQPAQQGSAATPGTHGARTELREGVREKCRCLGVGRGVSAWMGEVRLIPTGRWWTHAPRTQSHRLTVGVLHCAGGVGHGDGRPVLALQGSEVRVGQHAGVLGEGAGGEVAQLVEVGQGGDAGGDTHTKPRHNPVARQWCSSKLGPPATWATERAHAHSTAPARQHTKNDSTFSQPA